MLIRLLLVIAAVGAAIWLLRYLRRLPPQQRRGTALKFGLAGLGAMLVLLAIGGRIHWVGALIGASLPLLKPLLILALNLVPMLRHRRRQRKNSSAQPPAPGGRMSREEALAVLGLREGANRDAILRAHRQLMQHCHPDRGGSDYLAAKLNEARAVLLDEAGAG